MQDTGETQGIIDSDRAFKEIKDRVVMLTLASEYVCEEPLLKKIGFRIEKSLEALKAHIEDLEGQLVGKPAEEIKLDEQLEEMAEIAVSLQAPEEQISEKCVAGELGKDLERRMIALQGGVRALEQKVGGAPAPYTATDSVMRALRPVQSFFAHIISPSSIVFRVFVGLLLICSGAFVYLYATMESEEDIREAIEQSQARIQELESTLPEISGEIQQIKKQIEAANMDELTREEKARIMDLNVKAFDLGEKLDKLQVELKMRQQALEEDHRRLKTIREKSFLQRLLRR